MVGVKARVSPRAGAMLITQVSAGRSALMPSSSRRGTWPSSSRTSSSSRSQLRLARELVIAGFIRSGFD